MLTTPKIDSLTLAITNPTLLRVFGSKQNEINSNMELTTTVSTMIKQLQMPSSKEIFDKIKLKVH